MTGVFDDCSSLENANQPNFNAMARDTSQGFHKMNKKAKLHMKQ